MEAFKNVASVAHDNIKKVLAEWIESNYQVPLEHDLTCTGTTGQMIENVIKQKLKIENKMTGFKSVIKLKSGSLGSDHQPGAMITEGKIDVLIFSWGHMHMM